MRPLRAAVVTAVAITSVLAVLVGCGESNGPASPDSKPVGTFRVATVDVDGRDVRCVTWGAGYAGGIDCDWDGATR